MVIVRRFRVCRPAFPRPGRVGAGGQIVALLLLVMAAVAGCTQPAAQVPDTPGPSAGIHLAGSFLCPDGGHPCPERLHDPTSIYDRASVAVDPHGTLALAVRRQGPDSANVTPLRTSGVRVYQRGADGAFGLTHVSAAHALPPLGLPIVYPIEDQRNLFIASGGQGEFDLLTETTSNTFEGSLLQLEHESGGIWSAPSVAPIGGTPGSAVADSLGLLVSSDSPLGAAASYDRAADLWHQVEGQTGGREQPPCTRMGGAARLPSGVVVIGCNKQNATPFAGGASTGYADVSVTLATVASNGRLGELATVPADECLEPVASVVDQTTVLLTASCLANPQGTPDAWWVDLSSQRMTPTTLELPNVPGLAGAEASSILAITGSGDGLLHAVVRAGTPDPSAVTWTWRLLYVAWSPVTGDVAVSGELASWADDAPVSPDLPTVGELEQGSGVRVPSNEALDVKPGWAVIAWVQDGDAFVQGVRFDRVPVGPALGSPDATT